MILPQLHGAVEETVSDICHNGFVPKDGYFGQGMYFTSSHFYASKVAKKTPEGSKILVVCFVLPGRVYPVTEAPYLVGEDGKQVYNQTNLVGSPKIEGFSSHFTLGKNPLSPMVYFQEEGLSFSFLNSSKQEGEFAAGVSDCWQD